MNVCHMCARCCGGQKKSLDLLKPRVTGVVDSSGRAATAMVSSHSQGSYLRTVRQKKPSFKLYSVRYFDTVMRKRMHVPAKQFVGL